MPKPSVDVTALLRKWRTGEGEDASRLMDAVYGELRKIAAAYLRHESVTPTVVVPTELVNEAYLRLAQGRTISWQSRAHFYAVAAKAMRRILVDLARRRHAQKRAAGSKAEVSLSGMPDLCAGSDVDVLDLSLALEGLAVLDTRQADMVVLRFFGGLTVEEIAEEHAVSIATVKRELLSARLWLRHRLKT